MPSLTPSSEETRIYECCILYPYPINQKEEADLLKEIEAAFTDAGGKQVTKDQWGRRGLAYPIEGSTEGNFVIYYYDMEPAKLKEVEQQLKIMKNVLRHMFVKPPKHYQVIKYSEAYTTWLKERESIGEKRSREVEEKLRDTVAKKAKRAAQRTTEVKKKEEKPAEAMNEKALTEKLEKLISDDHVDL